MAKLKLNDKEYDIEDISDAGKAHLHAIRFTNNEIDRLKLMLAALETAKNAYIKSLSAELEPGDDPANLEIPENLSFD